MNIGFDLDKVFINNPPFIPSTIIEKLYRKKANGVLLYRIPSRPEQVIRILSHYHFFRPPISHNIAFLNTLNDKNHKYFIISSRFGFLKKRTHSVIKRYGLEKYFDHMLFNFENQQPHLFKNEVIKNHAINRYVDDDLHLLKFLAKENPKTKFFWLNDKEKGKMSNNLYAITTLGDILK